MWNDVILQLIASIISMPDKSPSIGSDFLKYFPYPSQFLLNKNYRDNGYLPKMSTAEYGDLVCFTGSDSDNYNEMPLFFHNLNFFFCGRDESVVFSSSSSSSSSSEKIRLILFIKTLLFC